MEIVNTLPGQDDGLFAEVPQQCYPANSPRHHERENINEDALLAAYVVREGEQLLGRAALYRGDGLQWNHERICTIGNYECIPKTAVSRALLDAVASDAQAAGATYLIGPMNGSTWDNYRFSESNDLPHFLLEPYHHGYYISQFQDASFKDIARYTSNIDTELLCDSPQVLEKEHAFAQMGVRIRPIDITAFDAELAKLHPFIQDTFAGNLLYSPITLERFQAKYRDTVSLVNPDYVLVAEDDNGQTVGFIFSYDDAFNQQGRSLIIKTLARARDRQYAGLGHVLANRVTRLARERAYRSVVHAFIIERGDATLVSGNFTGRPYKSYVLLGKSI